MSAVAQSKGLEQRITERLHESIGELVTDDDLKAIVERGVEAFFFKERHIACDGWPGHKVMKPPLVQELVEKALQSRMELAITTWLAEHPDLLEQAVERAVQEGAGKAVLTVLDQRFTGIFASGVEQMQARGLLPANVPF